MKVLLIDADSSIPNIPLMKLSTYHKGLGDSVELRKASIPFYPSRKKQVVVDAKGYDKVYVSLIFNNTLSCLHIKDNENIEYGGTGISTEKSLPDCIDALPCDYSIYPGEDTSYGFLTRGCIRNCSFCVVPKKEGRIRQVSEIDDILKHKKIKFLDNNILACPEHYRLLEELKDRQIKCQFNQGLDIRLINDENARLLSGLNYWGEYTFAFDDIDFGSEVEKGLAVLKKYILRDWRIRFFIYCHPEMSIQDDIFYRVRWCKDSKVLPYLMRDLSCWNSAYKEFYFDLAAWCNQPHLFKMLDFKTFVERRHPSNKERQKASKLLTT